MAVKGRNGRGVSVIREDGDDFMGENGVLNQYRASFRINGKVFLARITPMNRGVIGQS